MHVRINNQIDINLYRFTENLKQNRDRSRECAEFTPFIKDILTEYTFGQDTMVY